MAEITRDKAAWLSRYILPHEQAVRSFIKRMRLPNGLDVDDVIQEAYSRLASLEQFAAVQSPRAYFFVIARSVVLMHLRHQRVVSLRMIENADTIEIPADEPSPEQQVSDRQQLHLLGMALAELSEPSRKVFVLRTIEGLAHKEIGERLGISENAVQKSVAKTLGRLSQRFGRDGYSIYGASLGRGEKERGTADETARDERRG